MGGTVPRVASPGRRSAPHRPPPVLDQQAAVLHDVDPRRGQRVGDGLVPDAELHPHRARPLRHDVLEVPADVGGPPEHVDEVDGARDVDETAVDLPARDFVTSG